MPKGKKANVATIRPPVTSANVLTGVLYSSIQIFKCGKLLPRGRQTPRGDIDTAGRRVSRHSCPYPPLVFQLPAEYSLCILFVSGFGASLRRLPAAAHKVMYFAYTMYIKNIFNFCKLITEVDRPQWIESPINAILRLSKGRFHGKVHALSKLP